MDGDSAAVVELVAKLDAEKQRAAYRVLIYVVRRSSVGIEGANAVAPHTFSLESADLSGALALSLESSHEAGAQLRRRVRDTEASRSDPALCAAVVAAAGQLIDTEGHWIGAAFRTLVTDDPERAVAAVRGQSKEVGLKVIDASTPALSDYLKTVDELGDEDAQPALERLKEVLDGLIEHNRALGQRFAASLLRAESDLLVEEISERVERLAPIDDVKLARNLSMKAHKQTPEEYGRWFAAIPVENGAQRRRSGAACRAQRRAGLCDRLRIRRSRRRNRRP